MDPALVKKILDVIASQDEKAALALLPELVTGVAAEEAGEPAGGADPMAAAAEAPPPPAGEEPKPAVAASVSALAKALGCATDEEAAAAVLKLQKQVQTQADANAAVELEARRGLVARLVKCGVEKPATAWAKNSKGEITNIPVARLSVEPIAELRARVVLHEADGPREPAKPPVTTGEGKSFTTSHGVIMLTASEIKNCEESGAKPEAYAENKAIRDSARAAKGRK